MQRFANYRGHVAWKQHSIDMKEGVYTVHFYEIVEVKE